MKSLDPEFEPWARALLEVAGHYRIPYRITSLRRSIAEQSRLYRRYLAGQHPLPVAPPGCSQHNYGLAFDMVVENTSDLQFLAAVWKSWGGYWGGNRDPVHFGVPSFPCPRR